MILNSEKDFLLKNIQVGFDNRLGEEYVWNNENNMIVSPVHGVLKDKGEKIKALSPSDSSSSITDDHPKIDGIQDIMRYKKKESQRKGKIYSLVHLLLLATEQT